MSQINVNVVAPLGYTGPALTGSNSDIQIINDAGQNVLKFSSAPLSLKSLALGLEAGTSTTGCVAVGTWALKNATSFNNTAVGNFALQAASSNSTALGFGAGAASTGFGGTFIGYNAGTLATSGASNTFVGSEAGQAVTTGSNNVFVGYRSAIGNFGGSITTGSNNVLIGTNGLDVTSSLSNTIILGGSSITTLACNVTSITSLSDARDKKDVEAIPVGLDFINELNPVKFIWDDRDEEGKHDVKDCGFIAQDLKSLQEKYNVAEELQLVNEGIADDKMYASYGKLLPIMVKAIQELSAELKALKAEK
jgi:hypothetical protein